MLRRQDAGVQSSETAKTSLSESRVARCRWERWFEERWDELQVKGNTWCEGPLLWTKGTAQTNTRVLKGPGTERAHIAPREPNRWCRAEDAWALNSVQVTSTCILWVAQGLLSEAIVLTSGEKPDPRQGGTPVSRLFRLENLAHKGSGIQPWKPEAAGGSWFAPSTKQAPGSNSGCLAQQQAPSPAEPSHQPSESFWLKYFLKGICTSLSYYFFF